MKYLKLYGVLVLAFAVCLGGPLGIFSYRTQSIVLVVSVLCFMIIAYPKYQLALAASNSGEGGDLLANLLSELGFDGEIDAEQAQARQQQAEPKKPMISQGSMNTGGSARKVASPVANSGKKDYYHEEAKLIADQLNEVYGIKVRIKVGEIAKSWNYVTYPLTETGPFQFKKLVSCENDLGRNISGLYRAKHGDRDRVEVLAVHAHPKILLQVTRAKPQPLTWQERATGLKPLQTQVGFYLEGTREMPAIIDIGGNDSEYVNGGFFGQPGGGKTTTLLTALDNLLEVTPPDMLDVYGIDMKKGTFKRYANTPHMRQSTSNPEDAMNILDQFVIWCSEATAPTDGKHRLLVIDEFQMLINHSKYGEAALQKITTIMQAGREWGIRVWTATQNPNKDSYPATLKPLTHFKVCSYIQNDDYVKNQFDIFGASRITPKRELIFVDAFGTKRVTSFFVTPADREYMLSRLLIKWQDDGDGMANDWRDGGETIIREVANVAQAAKQKLVPNVANIKFPILERRALSPAEAYAVKLMKESGESLNAICVKVYNSKDKKKMDWIKEALGYEE